MIKRYSLSTEEMALCMGLINRPDLGKRYLKLGATGSTEEAMQASLTTASHSLVARGLADISEKGTPVIDPALEIGLFPVAMYDRLLQVLRTRKGENLLESIYLNLERELFTAHHLSKGVIHSLAAGPISEVAGYLQGLFPEMGKRGKHQVIKKKHHLTLGLMGKMGLNISAENDITEFVEQSGLPEENKEMLKKDILAQEVRGSLLFMDINSSKPPEKQRDKVIKGLLMLKGPRASWTFNFRNTDREQTAQITLVDRKAFRQIISEFFE